MDNPVCSCSICKAPMTQYHLNCLEEAVSKRQNETKELVKKLNDLKRENAEYRKKLQDGKIGREIEEHKEAAKKKTLESKKDTYEGFNIIAEEKIEKEKAELDQIIKQSEKIPPFEIDETKKPQPSGPQCQSWTKENEKELAKHRLTILESIRNAYYMKMVGNPTGLLKKRDEEGKVTREMCFLIHHIIDTIARCYFLELPVEYNFRVDPKEAVETNLNFLCGHFDIRKTSDNQSHASVTKLLVCELIEREESASKEK